MGVGVYSYVLHAKYTQGRTKHPRPLQRTSKVYMPWAYAMYSTVHTYIHPKMDRHTCRICGTTYALYQEEKITREGLAHTLAPIIQLYKCSNICSFERAKLHLKLVSAQSFSSIYTSSHTVPVSIPASWSVTTSTPTLVQTVYGMAMTVFIATDN